MKPETRKFYRMIKLILRKRRECECVAGDWQIGNTEDVEVGKPESVVQPEGTEKDWEKGNVEDVVVKD